MNIVILGPQGSGKGTQARLLAHEFGFFYFESGEFLRELATKNEMVKKMVDEGELVPEDEFASYVAAFFDEKDIYDNIIFDGFPRTLSQYNFFKKWLREKDVKINLAVILNISEETTINRLSARRQDADTGKIYNLLTDKPPTDIPQARLIQRDDDKPEAIKERLKIYKELTLPLIDKLKADTHVFEINGEQSIDEIQRKLKEEIKKYE